MICIYSQSWSIQSQKQKKRKRGTEDDSGNDEDGEENDDGSDAEDALKLLKTEYKGLVKDEFNKFFRTYAKLHRTKTPKASETAAQFAQEVITILREEDAESPAIALLEKLGDKLEVELYIFLSKEHDDEHPATKKAAKRVRRVPKPVSESPFSRAKKNKRSANGEEEEVEGWGEEKECTNEQE